MPADLDRQLRIEPGRNQFWRNIQIVGNLEIPTETEIAGFLRLLVDIALDVASSEHSEPKIA